MDESHSWDEWSFFHCEWQNGFSNVSGIMFVNYVRLKSSYISQGHLVWCLCVWIVWVCAYREIKCHIFERFFFVLFSFMNCGQFEVKRDFGWWLKVSFLFLNQFVFLFERRRCHSGYVKQRWNMSDSWQIQDLCGQEHMSTLRCSHFDLGKKRCSEKLQPLTLRRL